MKNIKTFFSMFGKLVQILDSKQKKQGIILFFLLIIVSLLEMLGVSVIIPFIITMLEPEKIMTNKYVEPIVKLFDITNYQYFMYMLSGAIILVYVLKNGFILTVNYYQSRYRNQLEKSLNVNMLSSYMKRPYTFFLQTNSAEIIRGVNDDIINLATVVDGFFSIFAEGLTCLVIGVFLICISPMMAISLLLVAGTIAIVIILCFKRIMGECGKQSRQAILEKFKHMNQAVNGIKEITVTQHKDYFVREYEKASAKAASSNTKYLWICKAPNRLIETVFIGALIIVVTVGYSNVGDSLEFVSALGAMGIAAVRILPSISTLTNCMNSLVYMRPSLEATYDNIMSAREYDSKLKIEENKQYDVLEYKNNIGIDSISFRYREELPLVLDELSIEIKKGDAVAFIGESGAGKSTLADVVLGLLQPEKGNVTVDGKSIYFSQIDWSKKIGYVPQMVFLLDDTIRKNIAFGIPDDEIDDKKVWNALEQAQLKDVVCKMEGQLDSIVGEKGIKLSGGQRQRIAIARALYHDPDIIILDEATSALDTETENAVMEAIDRLQGKKTLIIIAHRLSTIENCDRIYEIKNGKANLKQHSEIF